MTLKNTLSNSYLIGWAYVISFFDIFFLFDQLNHDKSPIVLISIFAIKILALSIVLQIWFKNDNPNNKLSRQSKAFVYFMCAIAMFHFGSELLQSTIDYNFLVVLSVPWFFYIDAKSN